MAKEPKQQTGKVKADETHELDMGEKPVNEVSVKTAKDKNIHAFLQVVRENAAYAAEAWKKVYDNARADLLFLSGGVHQWDQAVAKERGLEKRRMLTFNDLPQYIDQIINEQRQNGPSINISPADDQGAGVKVMNITGTDAMAAGQDMEQVKGIKTYDLSEALEGVIRNIEVQSQADSHYDTAHQHAVEAGFGWLRVKTCYAKPSSFDLDARISSVRNRFAVLIDPDFDEPDASDANFGFIFDTMHLNVFKTLYPKAMVGDLSDHEIGGRWGDVDKVGVAEYFERHAKRRTLLRLSSGETIWEDQNRHILDDLETAGITVVRRRVVDTYVVRWWKLTAHSVLQGPIELPVTTIPLIPVFGKELNIDGQSDYRGLIRHAKDPKIAENVWLTAATERIDNSPNAPWLLEEGMIEGRTEMWGNANRGTPGFLLYKRGPRGEKPERQQPAAMPIAEIQMALTMKDAVKSTIGMYSASVGAQSNEVSGKAIMARQREADVGAFAFHDNLQRAIRRCGILLTELVPAIYDTERVARIRHEDGSGDNIRFNATIEDKATGKKQVVNDLAMGAFDVVVRTGPSYTTLRQEAAEALMEFMRVAPSIGAIIVDKIADVMDWPGAKAIRQRVLHTIPRHMLTEEELEEVGEPPKTPPTPEQQVEMAEAEAGLAEAEAKKMLAEAKSQEAQAKIADIQAGADGGNIEMARMRSLIEEVVAEVLAGAAAANQGGQ